MVFSVITELADPEYRLTYFHITEDPVDIKLQQQKYSLTMAKERDSLRKNL